MIRGLASAGGHLRELGAFGLVGGSATALYAVLTWALIERAHQPPMLASAAAYLCSAAWSYSGHRWLTFVSKGSIAFEAPRFALLTLSGLAVAASVMKAAAQHTWPPLAGILAVCAIIPLTNYLILKFWVFNRGLRARPSARPAEARS